MSDMTIALRNVRLAQSGHRLMHCTCPLLTQSGFDHPKRQGNQLMPYRIRVTPKAGGDRQHVCGLRNGPTPKIGVELDVILGDRRICARVTDINLPVSKMGGAPVDEVYASEI